MFPGSIFSIFSCSCKQIQILQRFLIKSNACMILLELNNSQLNSRLLAIFSEMKVVTLLWCRSCILYIFTVNSCRRLYIYVISNICYFLSFLSTSKHNLKSQGVSVAFKGWRKRALALNRLMTFDFPAFNCMFKVNNRNTRSRSEICSDVTMKTPERCQCHRQWRRSVAFIVIFQHVTHLVLVLFLLTWAFLLFYFFRHFISW